MADEQKPASLSVYDYSEKSIPQAWVAALAYAGFTSFGGIMAALQGAQAVPVAGLILNLLIILPLTFGIYKRSRIGVVLMLAYVICSQLYVWLALRSFAGTILSVVVTGFLLRGAVRIFQFHREKRESLTKPAPTPAA